jgi:D-glycero-alpha-D-manno-heptose 1-phosphate guanylyltransferase
MRDAIILAGGIGTRLKAVVPDLPKPMAPIGDRPFLEILLAFLDRNQFNRVVLSLGYKANLIVDYFGSHFGDMDLIYEIEHTALGTGGALQTSMAHCISDHVFIFNGDTYLDLEVQKAEEQWQTYRLPMVIAREVSDTTRYGRLVTAGDIIIDFMEKGIGGPGLINAGCYIFPRTITAEFPLMKSFSLEKDFLAPAVKKISIQFFQSRGKFIDIGIPEDYAKAQHELRHISH